MNDQFGPIDEIKKAINNIGEAGLVGQKLAGDAVYRLRPFVNLPVRIDVLMEMAVGQPTVNDFDARHLNDAVPLAWIKSGRFRIEDYLAHINSVMS